MTSRPILGLFKLMLDFHQIAVTQLATRLGEAAGKRFQTLYEHASLMFDAMQRLEGSNERLPDANKLPFSVNVDISTKPNSVRVLDLQTGYYVKFFVLPIMSMPTKELEVGQLLCAEGRDAGQHVMRQFFSENLHKKSY